MLAQLRGLTGWYRAPAVLALLALALKMMMPPGFMPGTSLAAPILLCPDQGPMPAMTHAHGGDHAPPKAPHDGADHPCAFVGMGVAPLAAPLDGPDLAPAPVASAVVATGARALAPGRGLAAPPPPSHAPPAFRA